MEEQPAEPGRSLARRPGAIHGVRGDGMADRVEVNADLVRPTRDEIELEERPTGKPLADPVAGDRRPAVRHDRHARPVARVSTNRRLDAARVRRDTAMNQREVYLLD